MPLQELPEVSDYSNPSTDPNVFRGVQPYLKSWQILVCPSATPDTAGGAPTGNSNSAYLINGVAVSDFNRSPRSIAAIPEVATLILLDEGTTRFHYALLRPRAATAGSNSYDAWGSSTVYNNTHFDGGNLLFCDGHVKWRKHANICTKDFGLSNPDTGPACGVSASGATATALF